MTRSIFDPEGGETEHSGQSFTPQKADQTSQMPSGLTDGEVSEEEAADLEKLAERGDGGRSPAEALEEFAREDTGVDEVTREEARKRSPEK